MPWKNHGDYYSFKPDSIAQHAPTVSGVYGLFNFRHQIVIDSAANIRHALLRHHQHTKFRFRRFEPTGFTFEACAPEIVKQRAEELIREYAPICGSQKTVGLLSLWRSWRTPETRAFQTGIKVKGKPVKGKVAPNTKHLSARQPERRWQFGREQFGLAGALCGIIFLTVGLIGLVPHLKSMFDSIVRNPTAIAESNGQRSRNNIQLAKAAEVVANSGAATADIVTTTSAPAASSSNAESSTAVAPSSALPQAATTGAAPTVESSPTAKPANPLAAWSVQAMATTEKQIASDWIDKLRAKGYQAFAMSADINGTTWHRVRIGSFESRQDAETVRASLQAKEGFRDAYVAGNDKSQTVIALNRR